MISKAYTPSGQAAMITVKEKSTGNIVTIPVSYFYANQWKYSIIDTTVLPAGYQNVINAGTTTTPDQTQVASILPFGLDEKTAVLIGVIVLVWFVLK